MQPEPRGGQRRPLGLCYARCGNGVGTELEGQCTAGGERGGCGLTPGQGRRSGMRKRQRHAAGVQGGGRAPRGRRCGRWAPGPGRRAGGQHRGLDGEHGPGAPRGLRKGQACRRPGLRAPPAVRWLSPVARSHTVGGAESQWPQQSDTGAQWETETAKPAGWCPREGLEDWVHRGRVRRLRPVAGNPLCSVHHPEKTNDTKKTPKPAKTFLGFLGSLLSRQNQPGSTRATFRCPPTHVGKRSESPGKENKERPHHGPEMVPRLTYSSTCFPGLSCFPFTCTFLIKKCHKEFDVDPAMSIIKWN